MLVGAHCAGRATPDSGILEVLCKQAAMYRTWSTSVRAQVRDDESERTIFLDFCASICIAMLLWQAVQWYD